MSGTIPTVIFDTLRKSAALRQAVMGFHGDET